MSRLVFNSDKITDREAFIKLCPFGAIEYSSGTYTAGAACRMCQLCIKKGPAGAALLIEDEVESIDKTKYTGIAVFAEQQGGKIQPVTFELIGKARKLADSVGQPVYAVFIGGKDTLEKADELCRYGADRVFVYADRELESFKLDSYAAVIHRFSNDIMPTAILVGATTVGRQLAPRVAAKLKTGLTADCTELEIEQNTDLIQIRPAFGGNIMARIHTPNNRPQLATVRPAVMETPSVIDGFIGTVEKREVTADMLASGIKVINTIKKRQQTFIEDAEVIVAAGRGIKKKEDLDLLKRLADLLGGQLAGTRPMIEAGMIEPKRQIGLSGRTVRPKLIITCGVSGAIQFVAGMNNSDTIIAINSDKDAPIFKTAHYGIVGDLYKIVPKLIEKIEASRSSNGI